MSSQPPRNDRLLIDSARLQVHPEKGRRVARAARTSLHAVRELDGYDFIREIHRGGQGVVYRAIQRSTGQEVAIKLLRHGAISTPQERARLEREVQVLGQLRHPSIVTVHDSGEIKGLPYIVMDFIDGAPLDVYVNEMQPTRHELISLFARIAEAVQAAHLRGVIHRDLKPANILVDADSHPHIVDFGLAKLDGGSVSDVTAMTQTGQFLGSIPWAAPEQARGEHSSVDVRTDVYALGVVIWRTLTGQFPYEVSGDISTVLRNIEFVTPVRSGKSKSRLDGDVETILRKCLAKEPARRYQNAGELAADLRCHLDNRPIEARRDSTWYVFRKTISRHRVAAIVVVVFFLVVTGSAVGFAFLYSHAEWARADAQATVDQLRRGLYNTVPPLESYENGISAERIEELFLPFVSHGTVTNVDGRLVFEKPGSIPLVTYRLNPARRIVRGDFDLKVDFLLEEFEVPKRGAHHAYVAIMHAATGKDVALVGRHNEHNPQCAPAPQTYKAAFGREACLASFLPTTDQDGRLRIRRRGTTTSMYYWANGWQELMSGETTDEPLVIWLVCGSFYTDESNRMSFSNLSIETCYPSRPRCLGELMDDFGGTTIDIRLRGSEDFSFPVEEGGRLVFRNDSGFAGERSVMLDPSWHVLCGDFSLAVDFELVEFPALKAGNHFGVLRVREVGTGNTVAQIARIDAAPTDDSSNGTSIYQATADGLGGAQKREVGSTATSGTMRIRRSGARVRFEYFEERWVVLQETVVTDADLYFELGVGGTDVEFSHVVAFDNLLVETVDQ